MKHTLEQTRWRLAAALAVLSGILYCSWPLGPLLNAPIARRGLASELEARRQPYNWLFITCDVASSLLIIAVSWLLWCHVLPHRRSRLIGVALLSVVAFGVGTIIDALLPLSCEPSVQRCPDFTHDYLLLAHGIFSIGASLCLFVSVLLLWWYRRGNFLLASLMCGYILFAFLSYVDILLPGKGNWSQHYYITLCAVWLASLPYALRQAAAKLPELD